MDTRLVKEKIKYAREAVEGEEEPYKTEAFKIVLSQLLTQSPVQPRAPVENKTKDVESTERIFSFSGVSKHIYSMLQEGFFNQPKLLKEIKEELEKNSCFYDIRVTDNSLRTVFVKNNKLLTRVKDGSRWAYVVKK